MMTKGAVINAGAAGDSIAASETVERIGEHVLRYGLVLVLGWIGAMKFTAYEAGGIQPLVANSPLMSWTYRIVSVQTFSNLLGLTEFAIAAMIALRPVSARIAAVGSALAVLMFLTTLSFLFSTPGWEPSLSGFARCFNLVDGRSSQRTITMIAMCQAHAPPSSVSVMGLNSFLHASCRRRRRSGPDLFKHGVVTLGGRLRR